MTNVASVGQILQQRRKERGLSIPDIQATTKISEKHLLALENDDFAKIPGEAYVRGFLKLYAETLGLESQALLAQHRRESQGTPEEEPTLAEKHEPLERDLVKKPRSKWWILAAVAAVAIVLLGYLGWLGRGTPSPKPPKVKPITTPSKEPDTTKEAKPTPPGTPAPTAVALTVTVVGTDCWLEVTTDGKLDFTGTMRVGETRTWRAIESVSLFAASGRRLKAVFNGQDLGLLNESGEAVKKTFTAQGVQDTPQ